MRGLLYCCCLPIHHHQYTVRDIAEGWRDPAERMKRTVKDEETELQWKHSWRNKVRPDVTMKTKTSTSIPLCCSHHLLGLFNKRGKGILFSGNQTREAEAVGKMCRDRNSDKEIDRKLEKKRKGKRRESVLAQNTGNPYRYTKTNTFWIPCWLWLVHMLPQ